MPSLQMLLTVEQGEVVIEMVCVLIRIITDEEIGRKIHI